MQDRLQSLQDIEAAIWRELLQAINGRGHAWRTAVLATLDGDSADARSVVLREVDVAQRTLLIYTDARSPKVHQAAAHPQGTLVLWSDALRWQLRLRVALSLQTSGPDVEQRWARLKLTAAAQDYMSALPPGAARPSLESELQGQQGTAHFAVLTAHVQSADWLELHAQGHRRALFSAAGAAWLTP